ncbi:MAG: immunity protein Tsi6 family protein [Moraxellaceae bacterium]|nr:immunity protein Tsi6 family protein [Moraxellaceae bacterium]MDZ4385701.1 immunity protein Tsi6 family protein [Moraxellaceae bacterium]
MMPFDIVSKAKARCGDLLVSSPTFYPLRSVMEQLLYIEIALNDRLADRSKLDDVNIGLFAVREFEDRAPDFAEMLYEVEDVVTQMKVGKI